MRWMMIAAVVLGLGGCSRGTAQLSAELTQRFASEGIVRRADDAVFRYTEGGGRRGGMWDEGRASIVVTRATVFLHQGPRTMIEITGANGAEYSVRRDHDRVAIHAGAGKSGKSWSFRPPSDADGWAKDMRAVLKGTATGGE